MAKKPPTRHLWRAVVSRATLKRARPVSAMVGSGDDTRVARVRARFERALEQLKDAQWEIRASETHYRDLLEAQQDVIFRRDAEGRLTFVNEAFCRVFGLERGDQLGRPFAPRVLDGDIGLAGRGAMRRRFGVQVQTAAGLRWFDIEEHPVPGGPDRPVETQCVGRDLTEQRRVEVKLEEARDQAEAANRAKSRFLAAMSHEIRTPMNGILGMAALLDETTLTAEQRTYAEAIGRSGKTLLALIDEILDFSKIEAGRLDLDEAVFAVEDCVQSVVELMAPHAKQKGLELAWAIDPDVPGLGLGDEVRLRQIITNLVGNAVKFTDSGGVLVTVTMDATDPALQADFIRLSIAVKDTGIGISPAAFMTLFSEFEQGDEAHRRKNGGTGLGLAISRRLARAMGGDITARSAVGDGSEFTAIVHLRRHGVQNHQPAEPTVGHVLLALDAGFERTALRLSLNGTETPTAEVEPRAALPVIEVAAANDAAFDAVIVDGRSPPDVVHQIVAAAQRAAGSSALTALVVLDAAPRDDFHDYRRAGFDGYLVRPVRPGSLIERLRQGRPSDVERIAKTTPPAAGAPVIASDRARVLLVEDNDINALLARRMLEKAGCTSHHVNNGLKAVETVTASLRSPAPGFDLILLDVHMPVMDGLEAAQRLKALGVPVPPIIALTANAFAEDRARCLAAGMDDYLAKPFDKAELEAILHKWVRPADGVGVAG